MMANVPHVISGLGLRKFQADGFLLTRVYSISLKLDADFSKRRFGFDPGDFTWYSRRIKWYSSRCSRSPFSFSLPMIIQPLLCSSSIQVREGFHQTISYHTIGLLSWWLHLWPGSCLISDSEHVSSLTLGRNLITDKRS